MFQNKPVPVVEEEEESKTYFDNPNDYEESEIDKELDKMDKLS